MANYIAEVLAGLAAVKITRKNSPTKHVVPGETVLGEACDEVKRAYALLTETEAEVATKAGEWIARLVEIEKKPEADRSKEDRELADWLLLKRARLELLKQLFWHEVVEQFPSLLSGNMGIRKNWLIVRKPERKLRAMGPVIMMGTGLESLAKVLGGDLPPGREGLFGGGEITGFSPKGAPIWGDKRPAGPFGPETFRGTGGMLDPENRNP